MQKNVAGQRVTFSLFKSGARIANPTMAAGDFKVAIDGGAQNNVSALPTSDAAGLVTWLPSQAETNGDTITLLANDALGDEWEPLTISFDTRDATSIATILANYSTLTQADILDDATPFSGANIAAILTDTSELQGDWTNAGRLDTILDAILADTAEMQADDLPALIAAVGARVAESSSDTDLYYIGDAVKLTNLFYDVDGNLADPTTVSLTVKDPSGNSTTYTYAAEEITKSSTGSYYKTIVVDEAQTWEWRWVGAGTVGDANQGSFYVERSV